MSENSRYMPVRVSTFRGDTPIPFNAYVKVAGKFILFCREGDSFEGPRLERLKTKKLQKMYVDEKDKKAYEKYTHENIEKAYSSSSNKPLDIRAQIIHGALQAAAEDLIEDPASEAFYKVAMNGAKRFSEYFFSEPKSLNAFLDIRNLDFNIAHHGVITGAIALAIAEEMGLHTDRAIELPALVTGCMIHDLEHFYNHLNVSVSSDQLSRAELNIYRQHSIDGRARIQDMGFYDNLILDLVGYHDEQINGSGPAKKKEEQVDPFVFLLAAANHLDHLLLYKNIPARDALKILLIEGMGIVPLEVLRSLQDALKKRGLV